MSRKKRVLRVGCISLLLLAFVGYFAFSTFFFSPFEGKFNAGVAGLIPRNVDLYLARADLKAAFDGFPTLAVQEKMKDNPAMQAFLDSPEWKKWDTENKLTKTLADVKAQMEKMPLGLDLFDIAAGDEVALAANFEGKGVDGTDWAVYARATRYGKLAVSALKHESLLGLAKTGISASTADGVTTLSGGRIQKPIHLTRILDVVVAGSSKSLVQEARKLESSRSEGSLLLAAPYGDSIASVERNSEKRDIEVQFNLRELRDKWGMTEPWLDPDAQSFGPAFLGRLLPIPAVMRLLGVIDFDEGVSVDMSGELSSELMTAKQEKIYRAKGFDQSEVMEVASFVPEDASLFAYLRGPMSTILELALASLEPAAVENLGSSLARLNMTTSDFIALLDNSLIDRVAFVARPNDWGYESDMEDGVYKGPPHDGQPVFAWAIIAWMKDRDAIIDIREKVAVARNQLGISHYYQNPISGGLRVREFWSQLVPGTGHIAVMEYGDNLIISNRYSMIDDLVTNRDTAGAKSKLLRNDPGFQYMVQDSSPSANLLTWVNPRSAAIVLREKTEAGVAAKIESSIDYSSERRKVESTVLRNVFSGKLRSQLNADEAVRLDDMVDQKLRLFRDDLIAKNLPRELEKAQRSMSYIEGIKAALIMVRLSEKDFELSMRVDTPYDGK